MLGGSPLGLAPLGLWGLDLGPVDAGPTTLRGAIFARLGASTALAGVVGDRIFHGRAPQRKAWPAVVFHAPAKAYGHNLGGGDGTSTATVQVDCWAATPAQAEAAAEAVRLAFQGFRGAVGSVEFMGVFVDDVGETVERDSPGADDWTYRTIITLDARHRVSIPTMEG
jgi:hypothetical protein